MEDFNKKLEKGRKQMKRIAKFEKVSKERFIKDYEDTFGPSADTEKIYDEIIMPQRATKGSAGYDFHITCDAELKAGETIKIPTGIRAKMEPGWVLKIYPRSGLGFKYSLRLNNTVGIIDSDYYYSDNEGHIFIKITNESPEGKALSLKKGDAFSQGIFLEFGIVEDDFCETERNGGFGSTSKA